MRLTIRQLTCHIAMMLPALVASTWASATPFADALDGYVREGLRSNLALQAASLEIERRQAALDAARARFFPETSLEARYTRAEGGRQITIPTAALLNPIYTTLNSLLLSQGQPVAFPPIEDASFPLLREREQDTRITLRQPLFTPAIPAAVRTQRALLDGATYARLALARRLKRDISISYIEWLRAARAIQIVESSLGLLRENQRVNESLMRNGKITRDQVLRARAELLAAEQQLQDARNARNQASSYFNFLLNRPLDTPIAAADPEQEFAVTRAELAALRELALQARPELGQAAGARAAAESAVDIARAARWPSLSLGVDAGTQGERYEFGSGRNFSTVSVLLSWKFFDGGARAAQQREARALARAARVRERELAALVQLEVQQALDRLTATSDSIATAAARAAAARAGFQIASRKRDEGVISQVEFLDARNTLTSAELNLNITSFELLARQAELDFTTASGALPLELGVPQI